MYIVESNLINLKKFKGAWKTEKGTMHKVLNLDSGCYMLFMKVPILTRITL